MEDNSLNIHHRHIQKLVTEIFIIKIGVSPDLMNGIFEFIEKTIISTNKLAFQVISGDSYDKIWHRNIFLALENVTPSIK